MIEYNAEIAKSAKEQSSLYFTSLATTKGRNYLFLNELFNVLICELKLNIFLSFIKLIFSLRSPVGESVSQQADPPLWRTRWRDLSGSARDIYRSGI